MIDQYSEIIVAAIGLVGVIVTAVLGSRRFNKERSDKEQAQNEIRLQAQMLSFSAFLDDWQNTSKELLRIIRETEIDRILIFKAWNGAMSPKWTTAVYQMREEGQTPVQYQHFELDDDYVDRLRRMARHRHIWFTVSEIDDSFIKAVYDAEGVKSSAWYHIESRELPGTDSVSVSYVSFSSTTHDVLSENTLTQLMIVTGRLKGLAANFHEGDERGAPA